MVEANIHLKPLHTSILDMYKGVWDIGKLFQDHLRSEKTAITSWLRLTVKCGVTMQSNRCQLCTIYSKVNVETIPTNGPYHEWINDMVIGLVAPNWGRYEFLGGGDQKLLLAATSVLWRGNWWFGVKIWTPTSAEISLERSLHQLSIDAIKTW